MFRLRTLCTPPDPGHPCASLGLLLAAYIPCTAPVAAEEEEKLSGLPRGVTADDTFDDDDDEFSDTDASDNEHSVDELYDDSDDEFDDDDDDDFSEEEDDGDEHDRSGKTQPLTLASHPGAAAARKSGLALLADLAVDGATVVAARGGRGGRGNGLLDQDKPGSQRDRAEPGEEGQERRLLLEMCSVADIGLVRSPPHPRACTRL